MVFTEAEDYGELGEFEPVAAIQDRINKRFDALFHYDKNGKRHPYVCSVCNEIIPELEDLVWLSTTMLKNNADCLRWDKVRVGPLSKVPQGLQEQYVFNDIDGHLTDDASSWMMGVALSPRGVLGRKKVNSKIGFSCCSDCSNSIKNGKTPYNAIVNGNYVGCAPKELTELTPVELALLSPVKGYGYCFSYGGGRQMQLKGTMTFMRVQEKKTVRALAQVEAISDLSTKPMRVTECVVVLLHGKMTMSQKERARNIIRIEKLMIAVEWLIKNNVNWAGTNLEEYRNEFKEKCPVIIDKSDLVEGVNDNVEKQELFTCYFPDGTLDENHGGLESRDAFQEYAERMAKQGKFNVDLKLELEKQFASSDDDVFVSGCLLQFPCGIGGLNEKRLSKAKDRSITDKSDVECFVKHLNRLAFKEFQEPMFQLMCYSMLCKIKLIRRSRLQLRGKQTATNLANGLTAQDVAATSRAREVGNRFGGTAAARKLLSAVDACSQALPHTNEAAKSARSTNEAMQHHFGIPSIFFTVTFDDENSLLMQIMHGTEIDTDENLKNVSDDECVNRLTKRRELRLKYPGFAAKNFAMLLNICVEEVIGWNMRKNQPTEQQGLFGECHALSLAFEEQGRTTVHAHGSAWYKKLRRMQNKLFFAKSNAEKKQVSKVLEDFHERVVSTSLFNTTGVDNRWTWRKGFDHECTVPVDVRRKPTVVNDQQLRNMRHKKAYAQTEGTFAICPHCSKAFTNEDLLNRYIHSSAEYMQCLPIVNENNTEVNESDKSQIPKARMYARIMQFQRKKGACVVDDTPSLSINSCYQHHASCHVRNCFKCNKFKGSKHVCGTECECRYRLPDRARPHATVRTLVESINWYEWNGTVRQQPLVEFLPKRQPYDEFQNSCCPAISLSKFACNSNVSFITDGPVGQYQFKYQTKDTQADDSAPYHEVEMSIKSMTERTHEDDGREATRIICRAAFAHNKKNIIGPSMASFLNEFGSRFYFSERFIYFPVKDIVRLLNQESVDGVARYDKEGHVYFENQALHYLCRSNELEDLSAKEFFERYCVKNVSFDEKKRNDRRGDDEDEVFAFEPDTGYFKHPSARKKRTPRTPRKSSTPGTQRTPRTPTSAQSQRRRTTTPQTPSRSNKKQKRNDGTPRHRTTETPITETPSNNEELECREGVTERKEILLVKVPQWMFPDAAKFKNNNILTCPLEAVTNDMEIYSELLLAMFLPHRSLSDLQRGTDKPFTSMLRHVAKQDLVRERNGQKATIFCDEHKEFLQNIQNCAYNSMRYKLGDDDLAYDTDPFTGYEGAEHATHEEEEEEEPEDDEAATAYQMFLEYAEKEATTTDGNPEYLQQSLSNLSFESMRFAGKNLCGYNSDIPTPVLEEGTGTQQNDFVKYQLPPNGPTETNNNHGGNNTKPTVNDVVELMWRRSDLRAREQVFKNNPHVKVPDATGSVKSILAWAEAANMDKPQTRVFQSIIASFLLTFFEVDIQELEDPALRSQVKSRHRHAKKHLLKLKGGTNKEGSQLVMLMHGPGGSGKSTVINLVVAYAKEYCSHLDCPWNPRTIVITAMSGVAATLLHGETTHMALGLRRKRKFTNTEIEVFEDARLVFVDECSFAHETDFEKMDKQMRALCEALHKKFGGRSIVFVGDFSQLEPPGRIPIYTDNAWCNHFHGHLNAFIELDGKHRFADDEPWGERLLRFRNGSPSLNDIREINAECVVSENHKPPIGVQVACYANKDRDAVNCATFENFCTQNRPPDGSLFYGAVLVLMDNLEMENKLPGEKNGEYVGITSNSVKRHFYSTVGEDNCRYGETLSSRVDPVLKLYPNCPLMLTANKDVPNGQANGSRTFLQEINVKHGETPMTIQLECGTKVRAFFASQISSLKLKQEAKDVLPSTFEVIPEVYTFQATITIDGEKKRCKMHGNQFPIVSNTATTGHKLQGYTAISLLVNDWHYGQNWAYVVLSRVRTMKGLFLKEPLSEDLTKYAMSEDMKGMLNDFERRLKLQEITDEEYDDIFKLEDRELTTPRDQGNVNN